MSPQIDTTDIIRSDRDNVWHHLTQHKVFEEVDPLIMVKGKGKGMRITDVKGNEYLDAVSGGLWTVNVGYGRESIAKSRTVTTVAKNTRLFSVNVITTARRSRH